METNPQNEWDALSKSAKAFAQVLLGDDQTDRLRDNLLSYSQLEDENKQLQAEVASLKEILPFKDKYENSHKEFLKVAAERDSLSAQVLNLSHISSDYERLKNAYQEMKGKLATVETELKELKSSISGTFASLESLYQGFKEYCAQSGVDISRIPIKVFLQFQLQDKTKRGKGFTFLRRSRDKWITVK